MPPYMFEIPEHVHQSIQVGKQLEQAAASSSSVYESASARVLTSPRLREAMGGGQVQVYAFSSPPLTITAVVYTKPHACCELFCFPIINHSLYLYVRGSDLSGWSDYEPKCLEHEH